MQHGCESLNTDHFRTGSASQRVGCGDMIKYLHADAKCRADKPQFAYRRKVSVNCVYLPASELHAMVPRLASINCLDMLKPMPVPPFLLV